MVFNLVKKLFKGKKAQKKKPAARPRKKAPSKPPKKPQKKLVSKKPRKAARKPQKKVRSVIREKQIGIITHYFGKISVGIIKLRAPLSVGDKIHIKGVHDDFTQAIGSMQYNHQDITRAKKGLEVGIKVTKRVHENDKVYLAGG